MGNSGMLLILDDEKGLVITPIRRLILYLYIEDMEYNAEIVFKTKINFTEWEGVDYEN